MLGAHFPHSQANTDLFSVIIDSFEYSNSLYIRRITQSDLFLVWFISLSIIILRFTQIFTCLKSSFLLVLSRIPLCTYPTIYLLLMMDIWDVSFLGPLWTKEVLNICIWVFVWAYDLIFLNNYLGVERVYHIACICLKFWEAPILVAKGVGTVLRSHREYMTIPDMEAHSCCHLVWSVIFILSFLIDVKVVSYYVQVLN